MKVRSIVQGHSFGPNIGRDIQNLQGEVCRNSCSQLAALSLSTFYFSETTAKQKSHVSQPIICVIPAQYP